MDHALKEKESQVSSLTTRSHTFTSSTISDTELWHYKLGHLSHNRLRMLSKQFPFITYSSDMPCDICQFAKQKRLPFVPSTNRAISVFEILHLDLWGPFGTPSIHGHRFFLTIVDDYSRYCWTIMLKSKLEVNVQVQNFVTFAENQFAAKIKIIRTDNGTEFSLNQFFNSKGIIHQTSCIETPQQNGRVERKHQHLLNVARALLFQSKLPKLFWSYAVLHATFLINRIPTPLLKDQSPHELLFSSKPDLLILKPFGCLCYASTLVAGRHKFDTRARKCVFLGFKPGVKGYVLLDTATREVLLSRNVVFHEKFLPYASLNTSVPGLQFHVSAHDLSEQTPYLDNMKQLQPTHMPETLSIPTDTNTSLPTQDMVRTSLRTKRPPSYLADYHCNQATSSITRSSHSQVVYPLSQYISYAALSPSHRSLSLALSVTSEPSSYEEATKHACWREAMKAEILALEENQTWQVVDLPAGVLPIGK